MADRSKCSIYLEAFRVLLVESLLVIPCVLWAVLKYFIPKCKKNISGQVALITGGSEGIGRGIAFELARCGCKIAIANRNLSKGQTTAEEIRRKFKVEAKAFKCDVSSHKDVKKLRSDIKESLGTVDILINNAALFMLDNSLLEGNEQACQYGVDVNFTSWIWTSRTFLPDMIKQRRGHIVGISSSSITCPIPNEVTYIATKFGNLGFIEALREEIFFFGFEDFIKTSVVYPPVVKTNDEIQNIFNTNMIEPLMPVGNIKRVSRNIVAGILKDKEVIYPYWFSTIQLYCINKLPQKTKSRIMKHLIRSDKRKEYFEKKLKDCGLQSIV